MSIEPGTYAVDPTHSSIGAVARHLMVSKVRGEFTGFSGSIEVADDLADSVVSVEIDAATINTGATDRDKHLVSGDFLDVEQYPAITFVSTKVEPMGENSGSITGDLTIRNVTKAITLEVEFAGEAKDPWGGDRIVFSATGELAREDFGMTWNVPLDGGGILVSKTFKLEFEVQGVRQQAAIAAGGAEGIEGAA